MQSNAVHSTNDAWPTMTDTEDIPEGFARFLIEDVKRLEDRLIIRYGRRIFGGVMISVLGHEVASAIRPGAEVIVRYHTVETGQPGQVAHMLIRHPSAGGWAEIYADWE